MLGYETKFTFEENPEMFAAEYLARHFTENATREEEALMYEVLDLIEQNDSLEKVVLALNPTSQIVLYTLLDGEKKWCEETLANNLDENTKQEVTVLKEAYTIAVDYMQEMSAL